MITKIKEFTNVQSVSMGVIKQGEYREIMTSPMPLSYVIAMDDRLLGERVDGGLDFIYKLDEIDDGGIFVNGGILYLMIGDSTTLDQCA